MFSLFLKIIKYFCNTEGNLGKVHPNKKDTERYVFLLDGLLICCKQVLSVCMLKSFAKLHLMSDNENSIKRVRLIH